MTSKSIPIPSPKRIWFITGGKGAGKSTAACRFARPSEIEQMVVFDTEDSLSDIIRENARMKVSFGKYIRAYERLKLGEATLKRISEGKLPWVSGKQQSALSDYWTWFIAALDEAIKPQHRFLVIDTIGPVEAAATAWVETHRKESGWSGRWDYGKREIEAIRPLLDNTFEAIHDRGITDILLTSHTKNPWVEYAPKKSRPVLDRVKPGGRLKLWSRISTAMFWLVRPATPLNAKGAPSAIVMKARRGHTEIDTEADEWDTQSLIPPRIPLFTWREWHKYEERGWNPLSPCDGEMLLPAEERMMSELLSDAEYQLMILGAQIILQGEQQEAPTPIFTQTFAKTGDDLKVLATQGKTAEEIAILVGKPLPVVRKLLGRMK